jgi:hypothetical protein
MKTRYIFVLGLLFAISVSCDPQPGPLAGGSRIEKVLFVEDFESYPDNSTLPAGWWCEGSKAVRIEEGRLRADANLDNTGEDYGVSTIWLDRTFSGGLRVEFDAHVLASDGDKNNINFFFLFADPSGRPLSQTKDERSDGQYDKYHTLNGYVFTFLADQSGNSAPTLSGLTSGNPDKARFRMRDEPGFNLLQENFAYECRQHKTYHITVTKEGNRITFAVDGTVHIDKVDDAANPEHKSGIIGFRTWHTDLWWDNVKVTQLQR